MRLYQRLKKTKIRTNKIYNTLAGYSISHRSYAHKNKITGKTSAFNPILTLANFSTEINKNLKKHNPLHKCGQKFGKIEDIYRYSSCASITI